MEFKQWGSIFLIVLCFAMGNSTIALEKDSVKTGAIVKQGDGAINDSVTITGSILDSMTGAFPRNDPVFVKIDSSTVFPDSEGTFFKRLPHKEYHTLGIVSKQYAPFSRIISEKTDKKNYFVTCLLHFQIVTQKANVKIPTNGTMISGPCWTISGCIVDSKHDLAIKSDSFTVTFDDSLIDITKKGGYLVHSCQGGNHIFKVSVPGYHEVIEQVDLKADDKQPFITIPTTKLKNNVTRREITVTAKREPVHVTAAVSKTDITRTEIARTASTFNDPLRVIQTLPGVAAESDASARPIVRGGEPKETRVFLDDISLLQPYHFGGGRSMFNELAMDKMTLYKSGFPAEYSNATSALLTVNGRRPLSEPFAFGLNWNLLQTDAYIGIPLYKNKVGINASFQSSYYDFTYKRVGELAAYIEKKYQDPTQRKETDLTVKQIEEDIILPDYLDFSTGLEIRPNDKLQIYCNEIYNTDKYKAITRPSYGFSGETAQRDTQIDYASYYNILYGTAKYFPTSDNIITLAGAWQKRWWDLKVPASDSSNNSLSPYDVHLSQFNLNFNWVYSGFSNHILSSGFQLDYNKADFNVDIARYIQQILLNGNTNFTDFLGPLTSDNGLSYMSNYLNVDGIINHIFVKYKGNNSWMNSGLFVRDEWTVAPRLSLDLGARVELSRADSSITFSPRVSAKYSLAPKHELIGAIGHYTQNNYDISSIALSNDLKPEKVWHGSIGEEDRLLPWLTQKIDLYGKYYYDLLTEVIQTTSTFPPDNVYRAVFGEYYADSISLFSPQGKSELLEQFQYSHGRYESHYENKGRGYAYGLEYFLKYDPFDFWNGWISLTASRSKRQDQPGWRWYPFPLDRPLMLSLVNYYRLPRSYEISAKYRFMSGMPYTSVVQDSFGTRVSAANAARYAPYQRLDFKFSKGFTIKDSKAHFYIEAWNVFNTPNFALLDGKTKKIISFDMNWPVTMLFFGFDYQW
jgi:hypothetical protein